MSQASTPFAAIPAIDTLLRREDVGALIAAHGRGLVTESLRDATATLRDEHRRLTHFRSLQS